MAEYEFMGFAPTPDVVCFANLGLSEIATRLKPRRLEACLIFTAEGIYESLVTIETAGQEQRFTGRDDDPKRAALESLQALVDRFMPVTISAKGKGGAGGWKKDLRKIQSEAAARAESVRTAIKDLLKA